MHMCSSIPFYLSGYAGKRGCGQYNSSVIMIRILHSRQSQMVNAKRHLQRSQAVGIDTIIRMTTLAMQTSTLAWRCLYFQHSADKMSPPVTSVHRQLPVCCNSLDTGLMIITMVLMTTLSLAIPYSGKAKNWHHSAT